MTDTRVGDSQGCIETFSMVFPAGLEGGFEMYRAAVATMFDLTCLGDERDFHASAKVYCLTNVILSSAENSAARYVRNTETLARTGSDEIQVMFYRSQPFTFTANGRQNQVQPGEITFVDLTMPVEIAAQAADPIALIISRKRLAEFLPSLRNVHGFILQSGALHSILLNHMQNLVKVGDSIRIEDAPAISETTIQLVAAALAPLARTTLSGAPSVGAVSLSEIKAAIEQRITDPDLGPQTLIELFGVSRATLYRLCEPIGGVSAYILESKLRYALRMLADPSRPKTRISQMAYELGFDNPSTFTRAFRKLFGKSPSEIRAMQAQPENYDAKPWSVPSAIAPFSNKR